MKQHVNGSRPRSSTHPARNSLSDLAIEVATRMSQMNGIPSVSTLVDFESDAVDRVALIVNARFRMANGLAFPSSDLIERLREHLSKQATPRIARKKRRES